jgi:hypothetical protein
LGNIDFYDEVREYDGTLKTFSAKGLPDFLSAQYYYDGGCAEVFKGAAEKGVYNVYAKIFSPDGNYLIEGKEFFVLCVKLTVAVKVELKWETARELVYCGKDLRSLVKAYFKDEKGRLTEAPLTFTKDGEKCPFVNAGTYTLYASLGELYFSNSPPFKNIEIKAAKIDLSGISFNDLTVNFDEDIKRMEISGCLPQGVFVEYFYNGQPFYGAAASGEYVVAARFFAGENYSPFEMTAKLSINRNAKKEEDFCAAADNLGEITLAHYERLKELEQMYDEIIYKEGVEGAKQKLDAAKDAYDKLAARANERKEHSQSLLEKNFLPFLYFVKAFAAALSRLFLSLLKKL